MTVFSIRSSSSTPYGLFRMNSTMSTRAIVDQAGPRRDRAGDHGAARLEPTVTGCDDRSEHPFVDAEPSEPLRNDDVDLFGQVNVEEMTLDYLDNVCDPIRGGRTPAPRQRSSVRSTA